MRVVRGSSTHFTGAKLIEEVQVTTSGVGLNKHVAPEL